ncbi:uncharacterized protein METZ01_LOCUS450254 [marine metagenome]|uniref:Uncharacterized protein n=1 Tax=marine metagenome TaxID=408172 RepID=A0A382ZQ33_9ZZZZ
MVGVGVVQVGQAWRGVIDSEDVKIQVQCQYVLARGYSPLTGIDSIRE